MCHWQLNVLLTLLRLGKEGIKKESSKQLTIIRTEENLYRLILYHQIKKENTLKVNLNIKSLESVLHVKMGYEQPFCRETYPAFLLLCIHTFQSQTWSGKSTCRKELCILNNQEYCRKFRWSNCSRKGPEGWEPKRQKKKCELVYLQSIKSYLK